MLPLNPGRAGTTNSLQVSGATPGGEVTFIWGINQGTASGDSICSGLNVDILNFNTLTTVTADGSGNAFISFPVPGGASGLSVLLQAVDVDSCTESNLEMDTL